MNIAVVVLAAGAGTRMKSALPKVLHPLAGEPMIAHVLRAASALHPQAVVAVVAPHMHDVRAAAGAVYPQCVFVVQEKQQGTGHAVAQAGAALKNHSGTVMILFGDTPLLTPATLEGMARLAANADVAVLGMQVPHPTGYGRLVVENGQLSRIVECRDANAHEKSITLCNSGVMAVSGKHLFRLLAGLGNTNAGGEYYLTDIVAAARAEGLRCVAAEGSWEEVQGINSRPQLAHAEAIMQRRLRLAAMENGVTLVAPDTVFLSADTVLGRDTVVQPYVVFGPDVKVGEGCVIGPFARLRPGTRLAAGVHVGNFVEIKNSQMGAGAKANHLSYVGDSSVGAAANIGAGTITCNYDGVKKHRTEIGAGAFIGSNVSLVAPVSVGEGAVVGAGSVITQDVPVDALALERSAQVVKPGGARKKKGSNVKGQMSKKKG